MKELIYSPSIMCADLVNLEKGINEIEKAGLDTLHVDIIDGTFSPSMPLGIDTVKKIREITNMTLDAHLMSVDNEFFINELINIGVDGITFHYETSLHVDRYIKLIKNAGLKVGLALNPATSLTSLDYILPELDMVCLMLINPGFATDKNEKQVAYAKKKVRDLKNLIESKELDVSIQVDGRVSMETISELVEAGADNLVLGSTSLFLKGNTIEENLETIKQLTNR